MSSHIYFDSSPGVNTWRLQSFKSPGSHLLMTRRSASDSLPFGTRTWTVGGAWDACGGGNNSTVKITISACYPKKFTCDDGTCIAWE